MIDAKEIEAAKRVFLDRPTEADGRMGGSTSYLQRKLMIGYNRAAAIIEVLESEHFLTGPDAQGKRRLYAQGIEAVEEE